MAAKRKTTRSSKEPKGKAPRPAKSAARKTARKTAGKTARPKGKPTLQDVVLDALADMKAVDVKALDVRGLTDITDTMVVASGTSDRHVKSIADRVVQRCKEAGFRPFGMEGERDGDWVLVDLHDVVLHVMLPRIREFYALEKLWEGRSAAA
jgi:ribosome-associated protein